LKYFEIDLKKGEHKIRVEYSANAWIDISKWVKEYSFRYSLSPAKHWKSFGSLVLVLDARANKCTPITNIGQPTWGNLDSIAVWNFSKLPSDYLEISFKPHVSTFANFMIAIGPIGLTLFLSLILVAMHAFFIIRHRKHKSTKKYSWIVIAGSLIFPLLILIGYMFSFNLIDNSIGVEAGKYHGYTIFTIIFYPLLVPVYLLIMLWIDNIIKRTIHNAQIRS